MYVEVFTKHIAYIYVYCLISSIVLGILFEAYASPYSLKSRKKNVYAWNK